MHILEKKVRDAVAAGRYALIPFLTAGYPDEDAFWEDMGDLDKNGIIMSGGGSLIYGIDRLIERSTGIRTVVVDDAISCAAYGAGKILRNLDDLQDGMMNFYRKKQLKG